ncbi:unnamed protein product [Sphagnum troendelagicum]|uniref:Uncharacterized protein n=1 Tax=Sphagnum troendelagicum TaxID=128251 RepID=A0ABP0UHJ7_9BRYO
MLISFQRRRRISVRSQTPSPQPVIAKPLAADIDRSTTSVAQQQQQKQQSRQQRRQQQPQRSSDDGRRRRLGGDEGHILCRTVA